jgi:hypothetical protein
MVLTGVKRIEELAALAGFDPRVNAEYFNIYDFASLVQADEREACAVIAETPIGGEQDDITMQAKDRVAAAIRARGKSDKQD